MVASRLTAESFRGGQLTLALAEVDRQILHRPRDAMSRSFRCELLSLAGELDRAMDALEELRALCPRMTRQMMFMEALMRAEAWRRRCWQQEGLQPEISAWPTTDLQLRLGALHRIQNGRSEAARTLLAIAESRRPRRPVSCNGEAFDDFRDTQDLTASIVEVLTASGRYRWYPVTRIRRMTFRAPRRIRDFCWRWCRMDLDDGRTTEVHVAAIQIAANPRARTRRFQLGDVTRDVMELDVLEFAGTGTVEP